MSRIRLAAALATTLAIVAACGTGGPTTSPAGSGAAPSSAAGGPVAVGAREFAFDPSTLSVAAGAVTFHVTNNGTQTHEFEILKGEQVVDEVEDLVPGLEKDLTVNLEAGDYTYVCRLPGHEESGMKGTLTVTGS
jgi:iron uptake system component EfeO